MTAPVEPVIVLDKLSKSFGSVAVLDELSLDIYPGQTIAVIGESGTGKSVLLKHIIGLLEPDAGTVRVKGRDLRTLTAKEVVALRTQFGMLFQGAALFDSLTVGENVAFPLHEHRDLSDDHITEKVARTLDLVGLPGIEDKMPAELSGGMKKRVGLARAIVMDPEFILYDEPTTGLDPIMADVINDLIIKTRDTLHATSIAVTHDMKSALKISDRIVMLYKGKFIGEGTPEEIRQTTNPILRQFVAGSAKGPITGIFKKEDLLKMEVEV